MIKQILKVYHEHKRLQIELDLIETLLVDDYPVLKIVIKHLRNYPYDIKKLEKELEEYYGTIKSKNNCNST